MDVINAQERQAGAENNNRTCLESFLLCLGNEHLVSHLQQFLMSCPVRGDV